MLAAVLSRPGLQRDEDRLITAWAETEYHPAAPIARDVDAKPHLRRLLALHGIPCQFLATEPLELPPGIRARTPGAGEYAQRSALQDLLRTAGILDHRIQAAAAGAGLNYRLDRPALLIGIHARRQQTGHDDPPLVLVLVAIQATPDPDGTWHATMYSEPSAQVAAARRRDRGFPRRPYRGHDPGPHRGESRPDTGTCRAAARPARRGKPRRYANGDLRRWPLHPHHLARAARPALRGRCDARGLPPRRRPGHCHRPQQQQRRDRPPGDPPERGCNSR